MLVGGSLSVSRFFLHLLLFCFFHANGFTVDGHSLERVGEWDGAAVKLLRPALSFCDNALATQSTVCTTNRVDRIDI